MALNCVTQAFTPSFAIAAHAEELAEEPPIDKITAPLSLAHIVGVGAGYPTLLTEKSKLAIELGTDDASATTLALLFGHTLPPVHTMEIIGEEACVN